MTTTRQSWHLVSLIFRVALGAIQGGAIGSFLAILYYLLGSYFFEDKPENHAVDAGALTGFLGCLVGVFQWWIEHRSTLDEAAAESYARVPQAIPGWQYARQMVEECPQCRRQEARDPVGSEVIDGRTGHRVADNVFISEEELLVRFLYRCSHCHWEWHKDVAHRIAPPLRREHRRRTLAIRQLFRQLCLI